MAKFIELVKKELGKGKELKASLESLALKYKGEIKIKKFLKLEVSKNLVIPVPAGQAVVSVTPGSDKSPPRTSIQIKFGPPLQMKFSIFNENFLTRFAVKMGKQDIVIGDTEFDRKFVLRSNNVPFLKEFMEDDVRKCIIDIDTLSERKNVNVSLNKNMLTVEKIDFLSGEVLLDAFINRSLMIYGKLILQLKTHCLSQPR